jgi:hypothetical protein
LSTETRLVPRNGILVPVSEKRTYQDLAPILKCLADGLGEGTMTNPRSSEIEFVTILRLAFWTWPFLALQCFLPRSSLRLFRFWSRERAKVAAINTVTIEDAVVCHTLAKTFFPLRVGSRRTHIYIYIYMMLSQSQLSGLAVSLVRNANGRIVDVCRPRACTVSDRNPHCPI